MPFNSILNLYEFCNYGMFANWAFTNLIRHVELVSDEPITEKQEGTAVDEEPQGYEEWRTDNII